MKLEVVIIPVSDVDRSKEFYGKLGWRLDADIIVGHDFRVVQFTPPGSGCSVSFGKGVTNAAPGSANALELIVSDIEAARNELLSRGVDAVEVFHGSPFNRSKRISGPDPDRTSYKSYGSFKDPDGNEWLLQEVTVRLPGRIDTCLTSFSSERFGERAWPGGGRPRRTREAHRWRRSELARLVRRIHGCGTNRNRTADVSDVEAPLVRLHLGLSCLAELTL